MSLYQTYRRECDGIALARRLGLVPDAVVSFDELQWKFPDHVTYGPGADSAAKAMASARKLGWVRHKRDLPIFPGGPNSVITYDLCPACAAKFVPLPSLPVRNPGEADCVAGLRANQETAK